MLAFKYSFYDHRKKKNTRISTRNSEFGVVAL